MKSAALQKSFIAHSTTRDNFSLYRRKLYFEVAKLSTCSHLEIFNADHHYSHRSFHKNDQSRIHVVQLSNPRQKDQQISGGWAPDRQKQFWSNFPLVQSRYSIRGGGCGFRVLGSTELSGPSCAHNTGALFEVTIPTPGPEPSLCDPLVFHPTFLQPTSTCGSVSMTASNVSP